MLNQYVIGNQVRLSITFTDSTGTLMDPSTVVLVVRRPDQSELTFTPTKDATGKYHYDFLTDESGLHYYRFTGSGTVVAAAQGQFIVIPSYT